LQADVLRDAEEHRARVGERRDFDRCGRIQNLLRFRSIS
jgi:hypothetical protein